jgi:hypothetical protein
MQFADPYRDGFAECGRILMPGGRLVVTGWEPLDPADDVMPQRLRRNIGQAMSDSGFINVEVRAMPHWQQAERDMWEAAVAADADGDPAMESMRAEGANVLTWAARGRRVLATARAAFV